MDNLDQIISLQEDLGVLFYNDKQYTLDEIKDNITWHFNSNTIDNGICEVKFSIECIAPLIDSMLKNDFSVFEIQEVLRFESLFYLDKFGDLEIEKISDFLLSPQFLRDKTHIRLIERYLKSCNWQL